ncbi:hypothetical protein AB0L70_00025 [Kribbella sp. NPDC051952]
MTEPPTLSPDEPAPSPEPGADKPAADRTEHAPVRDSGPGPESPDVYEPL